MKQNWGCFVLGASILVWALMNRFQITTTPAFWDNRIVFVLRLDRFTGKVAYSEIHSRRDDYIALSVWPENWNPIEWPKPVDEKVATNHLDLQPIQTNSLNGRSF